MSSSSVAEGPSLVGEKLTSTGTASESTNTLNILKSHKIINTIQFLYNTPHDKMDGHGLAPKFFYH